MLMPYIFILFFAAIAAFYKLDKFLTGKKIWTRDPTLRPKINIHHWQFVDFLALSITSCILLLVILVAIQECGGKFPKAIPQLIFFVICTSTIIFATIHYNLRGFYIKHSGTVKIIATAATVVFSVMANSLAEDAIINYTHVDASQFPSAQKAFILIGIVSLWLYIGMYASLPAYFFVIVKLAKSVMDAEKKKPVYANSYTTPYNNRKRNFNLGFAALLGVTYSIMIFLGALDTLLSSAHTRLKEVLVTSSFHLDPEACNINNMKFGTRAALISDKKAVIATPDKELGYTFKTMDCSIQPVVAVSKPMKPIHRFHYTSHELRSFNNISPDSCPVQFCSLFNDNPCL